MTDLELRHFQMSVKLNNKCYKLASTLFFLLSKKMVNTHMLMLCML